jgi:CBS domain-containing protein
MALDFDTANAPFDRLTPQQAEAVRAALDIGYFRARETIIAQDAAPDSLFILIKGCVEEQAGSELLGLRGPGDWFDGRALVQGGGPHAFVAREETLCHLLPRDLALRLIKENAGFGAYFYLDISRKLEVVAREDEAKRLRPMMHARIGELFLHPAVLLEGTDSLESAGHRMHGVAANAILVRDGELLGIVTGTDLWEATILKRLPIKTSVASIARYPVVSVDKSDFVALALLKMTKHNVRRLAVAHDGAFVGFLEDIDLLAFLTGGAQLLAGRIERAESLADLVPLANEMAAQTRILRRQGVKIEIVCEIASDLNRALFGKVFAMTAPQSIRDRGCLIVMGSEGRGEQALRTDQDNGLILSGPVSGDDLQGFRAAFSAALESLGFPPCPGEVMVSNPSWSKTRQDFRADFRRWLAAPDGGGVMNIAIFYDAAAVAGDEALLGDVKNELIDIIRGERAFLARFASAVDAFPMPIGLFNHLVTSRDQGDALDLKKGGIFPIVHGVRALAIDRGLRQVGTAARIGRLADEGALKREFATELVEAFRFLMTLRLDGQLAQTASGGLVRPTELSTMERDLLRDALHIAKRLREIVRFHFNLAAF